MSADEFLQWVAGQSADSPADDRDSVPPTPYERVMLDAQGSCARNLVVVVDDSASSPPSSRPGSVRCGVRWSSRPRSRRLAVVPDELLEWEGERPTPLRLVTDHSDDADPMEVEVALVLTEVEIARTTRKVRRLHVRTMSATPTASAS